jgi:hypothetical protein
MKRVRFALLLLVAGIALQVAWYSVLMVSYVRTPGKLEGADFLFYYSVGRVARNHGLGAVYNLDFESAAQAEVTGLPVGAQQIFLPNHPPFLHPVVLFLSGLDYRAAYLGFVAFLFLLVAAGLPSLGCALKQNGWPRGQVFVILAAVLLFEPLFISALKGQDSALLLLGGLLWFSGLTRKNDRLAGLGLSLTLIRPQIAIVLAVPFLFRRRNLFGWFFAGAAVLGLYSLLQVGWTGAQDYLHILTVSSGGEGYGLAEKAMFNFTGLLLRLAPQLSLGLVHTIGWVLFAAALIGLCVLWGLSKTINTHHIALAVTLSLVAAPHLHYHDLALLAVSLVGLGIAGVAAGRLTTWQAAALPMVVSVILLFSEFWDPARFTVPYLLMAVIPALTWWYETH